MKGTAATLTLSLFLGTSSWLVAAPPAHRKPAPPTSHAFDPNASKLPVGFQGAPIPSLFRSLIIPARGEFEARASHDERVAAFRTLERPTVALVFSESVVTGPHYDADAGEFTLMLLSEHPDANGQSDPDTSVVRISVASSRVVRRSYTASNAFGANVVVKEVTDSEYAVILPASDLVRPHAVTIRVPAPSEDAPRLKAGLKLLLVCQPKPAPEKVVPRFELLEPTIKKPVKGRSSDMLIACDTAAFWAFDQRTGRVLRKVPLTTEGDASLLKE